MVIWREKAEENQVFPSLLGEFSPFMYVKTCTILILLSPVKPNQVFLHLFILSHFSPRTVPNVPKPYLNKSGRLFFQIILSVPSKLLLLPLFPSIYFFLLSFPLVFYNLQLCWWPQGLTLSLPHPIKLLTASHYSSAPRGKKKTWLYPNRVLMSITGSGYEARGSDTGASFICYVLENWRRLQKEPKDYLITRENACVEYFKRSFLSR